MTSELPCASAASDCATSVPRHFADVEALLRLPQLLFEHFDVVAAQIRDRCVAQHVHVCGGRVVEQILLREAHLLARLQHLQIRLPHAVDGAVAVPDVLLDRDAVAARVRVQRGAHAVEFALLPRHARVRCAGDRRAVAGHGARHVLVDGAGRGAGGVEVGAEHIGLGESAGDRLRVRKRRRQGQKDGDGACAEKIGHARPEQSIFRRQPSFQHA